MHQIKPATPTNPFMDPALPTMAALIEIVKAAPDIASVRRSHLTSSIRQFCKALGYEPNQVPANHSFFRGRLKRFHPLEAGIKKKRWQTITSDVNAALALAGIVRGQTRGLAPLSPEWVTLKALKGNRPSWGFFRLARFCSNQGIPPAKVNDTIMTVFAEAMRTETFKTNIDGLMRELCRQWNMLATGLSSLDLQKVTLPSHAKTVALPWDSLPATFRDDLEAFLGEMSTDVHPLSLTGPVKPLKPASITTYRNYIRYAHAALIRTGVPLETVCSLSVLVTPQNAKALLQNLLDRADGKSNSTVHGIAHVLYLIAGPGNRGDEEAANILKTFRKRLAVPQIGLKHKPREALRPFADSKNIETILALPLQIYDRIQRKAICRIKDARMMQVAVALELLLMRPIRRKNLTELRLGENIIRRGKNTFIRLPSDTVKNAIDIDHCLPPESAALLDYYIKNLLPLFGPNPNGWLFPGEVEGQHKSYAQLSRAFTKIIRDQTGLYLYPHLMRHFAAKIYLNENPGAFEVVRRVLAHKSLTTTTRSYVGFEDDTAVRLYDELVLRIRQSIDQEVKHDEPR